MNGDAIDGLMDMNCDSRKKSWPIALAVFVACLALYHANGRPIAEVDCVAAPYTAWSLVRHGTFSIAEYPELVDHLGAFAIRLADGTVLSRFPPGSALAAVPFMAPFAVVREAPLRSIDMLNLGKFVAAVYVAGAVVVFYVLCRRLVPSAATAATVLFAAGTCLWSVASQALWMHGPATFWLCVALWALIVRAECPQRRWVIVAGFALGLAVVTRPSTALFVVATVSVLAWSRPLAAVGVTLGGLVPAGLFLLYNLAYFGRPVAGGYGDEAGLWNAPFTQGLSGLLVAPSRGLLVYTPALILVPLGVRALIKTERLAARGTRALVLGWTLAAAGTIALYAKWHCWYGGWCFGPRFLCEAMPVCCLLFALAYDRMRRPEWRRAARVLVALSVLVHFLGVFGNDAAWKARHDEAGSLFSVRDTQIEAHARRACGKLTDRLSGLVRASVAR